MQYKKPALSIKEQVKKLKERGLIINDEKFARKYLSNISFYRLRAYTYPFQNNKVASHPFNVEISFKDIIELYQFDSAVRALVLEALQKIEIALRTQIIYQWSVKQGGYWHLDKNLYKNQQSFEKHLSSLKKEINRSHETFIKHYLETYTEPPEPPSWMSLEVSSFGLLSLLYKNLKNAPEKKAVAHHFGLKSPEVLANWMHNLSDIRNIAAHHGRLWNRRLTTHLTIPQKTLNLFPKNKSFHTNKLYASLTAISFLLKQIETSTTFNAQLLKLLNSCPIPQEKEMGFPADWKSESFWKAK